MARLPSITRKDQVPAEHHAIVDGIVNSRGSVHGPFTMLLHCPPLAAHMVPLGGYLRFEGKLDIGRLRDEENTDDDDDYGQRRRRGKEDAGEFLVRSNLGNVVIVCPFEDIPE